MSYVFLQLEAEPNCSFDYVDVFGGLEDYDGDLYGRYCGTIVSIYHIHIPTSTHFNIPNHIPTAIRNRPRSFRRTNHCSYASVLMSR